MSAPGVSKLSMIPDTVAGGAYHAEVQGSGPLRSGEVPPWHKRTTVRAEKRRLLTWLAEDDRHNRRENNDIRLGDDQRAHVPAIVLVECFTPSNIRDLFASIDTWPVRPPEYLDSLKNQVKQWRTSKYGGAWTSVATFARPDSGLFEYVADASIPSAIKAVEFLLLSPLPSLTALVAIFYPADECSDISDHLRRHYLPRIGRTRFRAKGKLARFTHVLPFSRARKVYYSVDVIGPQHLQREHMNNVFAELEAHCWQWLSKRALGKVGLLPADRRPSLRCILLDNLEPFGPIERFSRMDDHEGFKQWFDSGSDQPFGPSRGPISALGLTDPTSAWTTPDRDSFYFSTLDRYYEKSRAAYISANRSTIVKALGDEFDESDSGLSIFNYVLRNYTLGLLSAWTVDQTLSRYNEEISNIRDSSAASQSAYRVANRLNDFLVRDGHDATVVCRDAARVVTLDYSFAETPSFVNLSEMNLRQAFAHGESEQRGETGLSNRRWWREGLRFWVTTEHGASDNVPLEPESEKLADHYRREISERADLVASELELATDSISTSATLLQSMSEIRLQRWSLIIAVLAAVIAVIAIIVSLPGHDGDHSSAPQVDRSHAYQLSVECAAANENCHVE